MGPHTLSAAVAVAVLLASACTAFDNMTNTSSITLTLTEHPRPVPDITSGTAYLMVNVSNANETTNTTYLTEAAASWVATQYASSAPLNGTSLSNFVGNLTWTSDKDVTQIVFSTTFDADSNYNGLKSLYDQLVSDASAVWTSNYAINGTSLEMNGYSIPTPAPPSRQIAVALPSLDTSYVGLTSSTFTISLSCSGSSRCNSGVLEQYGRVGVELGAPSTALLIEPSVVNITDPDTSGTFTFMSYESGTYNVSVNVTYNTSDAVYTLSNEFLLITVLPKVNITVSNFIQPSERQYSNVASRAIPVVVLSRHKRSFFDAYVDIHSSPSGLTISPSTLHVTQNFIPVYFSITGAAGTYQIWYTMSTTQGAQTADFIPPRHRNTLVIRPAVHSIVGTIPTLYVTAKVDGAYGGAWSPLLRVSLKEPPTTQVWIDLSGNGLEFYPPRLNFDANTDTAEYRIRAFHWGARTVDFTIGGTNANAYAPIPSETFVVRDVNTQCFGRGTLPRCRDVPSCNWNALTKICQNSSLAIEFPTISSVFTGERGPVHTIRLPTAPQRRLVLRLAARNVAFHPSSVITFEPNTTTASISITGIVAKGDTKSVYPLTVDMEGPDYIHYTRPSGFSITVFGLISSTMSVPVPFFVGTTSKEAEIVFDMAPEIELIVTPTSPGLSFRQTFPSGRSGSMRLGAGETTMRFVATSTTSRVGSFMVTLALSGANAVRVAPLLTFVMTVLPSGELQTPPTFNMKALTPSNPLHVGISVPSPNGVRLEMTPKLLDGTDVSSYVILKPSFFDFKDPIQYGTFDIETEEIGSYKIEFALGGADARNYLPAQPVEFQVTNGSSALGDETYITKQPPAKCRVSTGVLSFMFIGQEPLDPFKATCQAFPNPRDYLVAPTPQPTAPPQTPVPGTTAPTPTPTTSAPTAEPVNGSNATAGPTATPATPVPPTPVPPTPAPTPPPLPPVNCAAFTYRERCLHELATTGSACLWTPRDTCQFYPQFHGIISFASYGSSFTAVLLNTGEVYTIGKDVYGQLGHHSSEVQRVALPENRTVAIACGATHTIALTESGRVYTWGSNSFGQLGHTARVMQLDKPGEVQFGRTDNITCVSAGSAHSAARSYNGAVFTWGDNTYGQLGDPSTFRHQSRRPVQVSRNDLDGEIADGVQCGEYHTAVALKNGAVYTFGRNNLGQLGREGYDDPMPKQTGVPVPRGRLPKFSTLPTHQTKWIGRRECP